MHHVTDLARGGGGIACPLVLTSSACIVTGASTLRHERNRVPDVHQHPTLRNRIETSVGRRLLDAGCLRARGADAPTCRRADVTAARAIHPLQHCLPELIAGVRDSSVSRFSHSEQSESSGRTAEPVPRFTSVTVNDAKPGAAVPLPSFLLWRPSLARRAEAMLPDVPIPGSKQAGRQARCIADKLTGTLGAGWRCSNIGAGREGEAR